MFKMSGNTRFRAARPPPPAPSGFVHLKSNEKSSIRSAPSYYRNNSTVDSNQPPPPPPPSSASSMYVSKNKFEQKTAMNARNHPNMSKAPPSSSIPKKPSVNFYSNTQSAISQQNSDTYTRATINPSMPTKKSGESDWFIDTARSQTESSSGNFGSTNSLESQSMNQFGTGSGSGSGSGSGYYAAPSHSNANPTQQMSDLKISANNLNPMFSKPNTNEINGLSGPMTSNITYKPSLSSVVYDPNEFAHEPPLMEELGIHIPHIVQKSRAVILPSSRIFNSHIDPSIMDDDDLAGPIAFALLLGGELLLTAKIYLGYIYGFGMFGCFCMALLLNLMCPLEQKYIPVWSVTSILGYSLLPVNVLAFLNIFLRVKNYGKVGMVLGTITVLWSTTASTRLFERGFGMRDQRYLVAYPAALLYSCFVIITIF